MARDSNGNYSLPSGYKATPGETILASQHNPPLEDLASAMTGSLPRDGSAPMGGSLRTVTGSAGSPAIYPNGNPAVGIHFADGKVNFLGPVAGLRFIGELIPWTLITAPALTVFPFGQTLLRASYPDLWAIAQTEIAGGNAFYNNGNGTTTFGIGDLRGRTIAAIDHLGGVDSGRNISVHEAATTMGGTTGSDTHTLTQAQLPVVTPTFTGTPMVASGAINATFGVVTTSTGGGGFSIKGVTGEGLSFTTNPFTPAGSVSSFGSGAAHNNIQHTMFLKFVLYAGA